MLSMTSEIDRQNLDDLVRVSVVTFAGVIAVLVVDASGAAYLVMDCARIPLPFRSVMFTPEDGRRTHSRRHAGSRRRMCPELTRCGHSDLIGKTVPYRDEPTMDEHSVNRLGVRSATG